MTRPQAARTTKRHYTGDHNGVGTVLESCLMQLTFENGQRYDGEICIVKRTGGHGSLPYAVTCRSEVIWVGDFQAVFASLADAAAFAKF